MLLEWLLQIILAIYSSLWEIWHIRVKTQFWKLQENWGQDEALTGIQKVRERKNLGESEMLDLFFIRLLEK